MNGKALLVLLVGTAILAWLVLRHPKGAPPPSQNGTTVALGRQGQLKLPAAALRVREPLAEPEPTPTNLFTRLANGDVPQLTPEQIENFLTQNHRDAGSLLGAFRTSGDKKFLKEAEEKYPNDPRVAYAAAFKSDSAQERTQWLQRLQQLDPENALPGYLAALDAFKSGQPDQAVRELSTASRKTQFQDYTLDFLQNAEEAYRSAGYSEADAKTIAATQLLLPDLKELRDLGRNIVQLANGYQQAGDAASAQAALQLATTLGQRFGGYPGEPLISELVGIAIERDALGAMDPNSSFGNTSQTVQQRLDQLNQTRQTLKDLALQEDDLFNRMSPQDVVSYWDRWRVFGSAATLRWAVEKYGRN